MDDVTMFTCMHHLIKYHEDNYRQGKSKIDDTTFDKLLDAYTHLADELFIADADRLDKKVGSDLSEDTNKKRLE